MSVITTLGFSQCELMNHNAVIGIIPHLKYSTESSNFLQIALEKLMSLQLFFLKRFIPCYKPNFFAYMLKICTKIISFSRMRIY